MEKMRIMIVEGFTIVLIAGLIMHFIQEKFGE
jgi:hypothetical protein